MNFIQAKPSHSAVRNCSLAPSFAHVLLHFPYDAKRIIKSPAARIATDMYFDTFFLFKAVCAYVEGLSLFLRLVGYKWCPFMARVLEFVEPHLRAFC